MRTVGCVVAAGFVAAGMIFGAEHAAADPLVGGDKPLPQFLVFGGVELWRHGGTAHQGFLWSPGSIEREGFVLKLLAAEGVYHYRSGSNEVRGEYGLGSVMAGYRFKHDRSEFTLFAGPDFQAHGFTPDDPGNRLRGSHWGIRGGIEGWYQPSETFMANGAVSVSTIGANYWVRGAVGWRLFDFAWLGPELTALGGPNYRQFRAGAHVTAFRWSLFEFSVGAGYARDSDERNGFYGRLGVLVRGNPGTLTEIVRSRPIFAGAGEPPR
jgi:hypothetical protein